MREAKLLVIEALLNLIISCQNRSCALTSGLIKCSQIQMNMYYLRNLLLMLTIILVCTVTCVRLINPLHMHVHQLLEVFTDTQVALKANLITVKGSRTRVAQPKLNVGNCLKVLKSCTLKFSKM